MGKARPGENDRLTETLVELVRGFVPWHDGMDLVWGFWLRDGRSWSRLMARRYRETYFISAGEETISYPDPGRGGDPPAKERLGSWLRGLRAWKAEAERDPAAAQARLAARLPLTLRTGVILRKNLRTFLPDWCPVESELSARETAALMRLLDRPDPAPVPGMTAARFLRYCRAAYQANPEAFRGFKRGLSGREYYRRYADGRDGGLLALEPRSGEAFARWYDSGERVGAHPWEIYRGGNSTHIDLAPVRHPTGGWTMRLEAFSSARLVETCRIALALDKAGLPFALTHRESYKSRLLQEDWVGVVPERRGIAYAWHDFPGEWGVADCVHLEWIYEDNPGRRRELSSKLRHLVSWLPERVNAFPANR